MFLILPEKPYIYNNYFLHFITYKKMQTNIVSIKPAKIPQTIQKRKDEKTPWTTSTQELTT